MRVAVIDQDLCKPDKCNHECENVCPINRAGKPCITIGTKAKVDEQLCLPFCNLCVKACPFGAIKIVNTPEQLKESPIHRFGENRFVLFRLPFPARGEVVGLLGQNGLGKTSAIKILAKEIEPNLGVINSKADQKTLLNMFRGSEFQAYLEEIKEKDVKVVYKIQQIDALSKLDLEVNLLLDKYDERGIKDSVIKELELDNCLKRKLGELSGGELQRVAIAVVCMRNADFYFFDEPSSYLDVKQRMSAAKLIRSLCQKASVVVVDHDLATLDFLADKIHVFYGEPGAYGVVSKAYGVRNGINTFLDGYIKEDNIRIHEPINFLDAGKSIERNQILTEFTKISKKYNGFSLAVEGGKIYKKEVLAVFGQNGIGKTTFAKILAGVEEPDSGEVTKSIKISYKPQYISQDFDGIVSELFVGEIDREYQQIVTNQLGIERLLEKQVSTLSGGELQRVAIALCLSRSADLFLLDEPSAFLDAKQRFAVSNIIKRICEQKECSAIVIDHDLLFLSYVGDRAMLFHGEPGKKGQASQYELSEGFNVFLKDLGITFRKEPETGRPRANKLGSQKDLEQKSSGKYFLG